MTQVRKYTTEERMSWVATFYDVGTYAGTARKLGVNRKTVENFIKSPEAQQWLQMIRENAEEEFRNKTTKLIFKGLEQLEDRIDKGNVKTALYRGEVKEWREPMSSKDLTITTGTLVDKLRVSLNLPTKISRADDAGSSLLDRFEKIADSMIEKRATDALPGEKVN